MYKQLYKMKSILEERWNEGSNGGQKFYFLGNGISIVIEKIFYKTNALSCFSFGRGFVIINVPSAEMEGRIRCCPPSCSFLYRATFSATF